MRAEEKEKITTEFKVWKTVELFDPGLRTGGDFHRALEDRGFEVSYDAMRILGSSAFERSVFLTVFFWVDLVKVSVAELGFKKRTSLRDIYKRAQELGLILCPAEVGPQLRLQYKDQPKDECLLVAMEPIAVPRGDISVFSVQHYEGLWLHGYYGENYSFTTGDYWVFVRPRK